MIGGEPERQGGSELQDGSRWGEVLADGAVLASAHRSLIPQRVGGVEVGTEPWFRKSLREAR